MEMYIGNISRGQLFVELSVKAQKLGFPRLLGGRYSWLSVERRGQETAGNPPPTFAGGKKGPEGELPQGWWYDEDQNILSFAYYESYLQGQCSAVYWGR